MQILGLVKLQISCKNHSIWQGVLWLFTAVTDCILVLLTHFCLSVIQEPEIWCFLAFFMVKFKEIYVVSTSNISMSKSFPFPFPFPFQNQPKSSTTILAYHLPRATHFPGCNILRLFVKILYFSSLCVKFQPNFDHFSSSPNYVRGAYKKEKKDSIFKTSGQKHCTF